MEIESGVVTGHMPTRALKLLFEWVDLHKTELLENWELARAKEALKEIEPLN